MFQFLTLAFFQFATLSGHSTSIGGSGWGGDIINNTSTQATIGGSGWGGDVAIGGSGWGGDIA